jgi:hypothetical protein
MVAIGLAALTLAGCDDNTPDAPDYVTFAKAQIYVELNERVGLPCYWEQYNQQWFVLCFDRNQKNGPMPLFSIDKSGPAYIAYPANGKAMQYGEHFREGKVYYLDEPVTVDTDKVFDVFRKTYPPTN